MFGPGVLLLGFFAVSLFAVFLANSGDTRRLAIQNCYRADGSYCPVRARFERQAFCRVTGTVFVACVLVLAPVVVCVVIVHRAVIPVPMAAEALLGREPSPNDLVSKKRGSLESLAQDHEAFIQSRGGTTAEATTIQRLLWNGLAIFCVLFALVGYVMLDCIWRLSRSALREYRDGVRVRSLIVSREKRRQDSMSARRPTERPMFSSGIIIESPPSPEP